MELFITGRGPVRLDQSDFVGQGGEGRVYARGSTAYKIYADPARMIPVAKIKELAVLAHGDIIRPDEVLLDGNNRPVGYTMRRVQDAEPLCRLFTRAFRDRKGVTQRQIIALVREFQETVQYVHDRGVLVVDMNEMNFLVDRDVQRILFIDVDSYMTPGFPATAIMDSIRDRHASSYSIKTDWFSFAVLAFQMFIGVHPYRGKHPTLTDLDARMTANVSVFNPAVTVPATSYPLDTLPSAYRDWFEAVFEHGQRTPPPTGARSLPTVTPRILHLPASVRLKIRQLARFGGKTLSADDADVADVDKLKPNMSASSDQRLYKLTYDLTLNTRRPTPNTQPPIAGSQQPATSNQQPATILQLIDPMTALTTEGVFLRTTLKLPWSALNLRQSASSADKALLVTPRLRRLVLMVCDGGRLRFWNVAEGVEIPCSLNAGGLFACGDRVYVRQGGALYEVRWLELPGALQPMLHAVANVLPHATRLFDGAAVQDILGACHASLFPQPGMCCTVRIPELDGSRILDGCFENNVLMLASEQAGKYAISILRFGERYRDYDLRTIADAASPELNFVTLDNGICLYLNPQQELEIFSNRKGASSLKVLDEPALHGARLFKDGTQALFARGDTLYEMKMGS